MSMDTRFDDDGAYAFDLWVSEQKCPHDGEQLMYFEGTVDQTEQGDDIDGFWFACPKCNFHSEVELL